jgi:carboxylate-amine ligase
MTNDDYKFGIEEEYFLVDAETKAVVVTRPPSFLARLKDALGDRVSGEMLQAQVEVSTSPHTCMNTAAAELKLLSTASPSLPPAPIQPRCGTWRSSRPANAMTP